MRTAPAALHTTSRVAALQAHLQRAAVEAAQSHLRQHMLSCHLLLHVRSERMENLGRGGGSLHLRV